MRLTRERVLEVRVWHFMTEVMVKSAGRKALQAGKAKKRDYVQLS